MPDEPVTKTSIDALVEYLKTHGETDASTLAKALGVSETLIEEWSNILEKSNIVKINYRAAKMYVAPLAVTKEGVTEIQHGIEIKKESLINEVNAQLNAINQLNQRTEELTKFIQQGKEIFKKKVGPLKDDLDELYKMSSVADKRYNEVKEKKKEIDEIAKRLEKEIEGLRERSSAIEHFQLDTANAEKVIEDMYNKIELMRKMLEDEEANRKRAFEELEKSERKLADSIRDEISVINEVISSNKKALDEDKRISAEYKKKAIELRNRLESESKKIIDEVSKDKEEIDKYSALIETKYLGLREKVEDLKKNLGDITKIDDTLRQVEKVIEEVNKAKGPLEDELNKILAEAKAIDALSKEDIVSSSKKLDEMENKASGVRKDLNEIDKKLSEANDNLGEIK